MGEHHRPGFHVRPASGWVNDPNAPVQRNLEDTLLELQRTSRALRVLSDYLQQHPEALLRGKPADAPVPAR